MLKHSLNQKGNSILLVIIALLILSGTCIELLSGGISQVPNLIKNYRAISTRDSVESSLMNRLSFAGIYRSSIHPDVIATNVNQKLLICTVGQPGEMCTAGEDYPISLFSWETDPLLVTTLKKITGDNDAPVFYDMKGNLCPVGAGNNCPFLQVVTTFSAICSNNAATCATAKSIKVKYAVQAATAGSANNSYSMARKERVAPDMAVWKILPLEIGSAGEFAKVGSLIIGDTFITPELLAAIEGASDLRGDNVKLFASLAQQAGITDRNLILGLASSVSASGLKFDLQSIKDYADLIKSLNITDPIVLAALPVGGERNPVRLAALANAITAAGMTDIALAKHIVWNGITDPVTIAAYMAPKNPQILEAIDGSGRWWIPQAVNAIASTMYLAGIKDVTPANRSLVDALSYAGIVDLQQVKDISKVFDSAHITDPVVMNAVSIGRLTNNDVAQQFAASVASNGLTDQGLISGLALGGITEASQVANFVSKMAAAGPSADPWLFSRTGITDQTAFNNFFDTVIKLNFVTDGDFVNSLAAAIRDGNITSKTDIEALAAAILASKSPVKPADSTIVAVNSGTPGTSTSTVTSGTIGTGTTATVATPSTIQLLGSCTSGCGSAF